MDSTETITTADETEAAYEPPKAAWDLKAFIKAAEEEIAAKTVDCKNCPVFMLCEAGEGSTGYWCSKCGSIGVWCDDKDMGKRNIPRDILLIDCNKHKFPRPADKHKLTRCALCSGGIMDLVSQGEGANNHYVYTKHAGVSATERQKVLKREFEHHEAQNAAQRTAAKEQP